MGLTAIDCLPSQSVLLASRLICSDVYVLGYFHLQILVDGMMICFHVLIDDVLFQLGLPKKPKTI